MIMRNPARTARRFMVIKSVAKATGIAMLCVVLLSSAVSLPLLKISEAQAVEVASFSDSSRLISIGGSLTEIVYALGEQERLVGRDQTGMYPPEAEKLPDVGYMRSLSAEGVLALNPSAILMLEGSGPDTTLDVLDKASVPIVTIADDFSRQGVVNKINAVGRALGVEDKAAQLANKVDLQIAAIEENITDIAVPQRVLFILSQQGGRIMASGRDTAADTIIKLAGGVNAIDEFEGFKQLTDEAIDKAAPDLILLMGNGIDQDAEDEKTAAEQFTNPALMSTPAIRNNKILRMDGLYLLGFGPRIAQAIEELHQALYDDRKP